MAQSTTTEFLLKKILQNPSEENYKQIIQFISGTGNEDFILSLKSNNTLSIIFLKNYVQKWIDENILQNFYNEDFTMFLIQCCTNGNISYNNWVHVAGYLEIISNNYLISDQIVPFLLEYRSKTPNIFIFIDSIFKKYTIHPRSNRLFKEIGRNIELFFPVFEELFFAPAILEEIDRAYQNVLVSAQRIVLGESDELIQSKLKPRLEMSQEYVLSIFYSLTYQDIHPLFEDNAQQFFKVFFILFDQNQIIINEIFDLFISKYPEITNFDLIILTISRINTLDGLIINTLTNAFNYSRTFPAVIVGFLKRTLAIQMDEDWLANTQNLVRGNDIQRGFVHRLIRLINVNPMVFEGEPRFFVASVLRFKDQQLINQALSIVKEPNPDMALVFTAFRFLLTVHEYSECHIGYFDTNIRYISMKYLSNYIKSTDSYHKEALLMPKHSSCVESVDKQSHILGIDRVISLLEYSLDEFSSELLFRMVKRNDSLLSQSLYNTITRIFKNIMKIPLPALTYLFDIYILLSLKLSRFNLEIIEIILNEEMVDFYNLCFLYISVLMKETNIKDSLILQILSHDQLWKTTELHTGLCFILISAYQKGLANIQQIESISTILDRYNRILILSKLSIRLPGEYSEEENYLVNDIFNGNWFLESFINKKYTRIILKKLLKDENVADPIKQCVIEKNLVNIEYENILHSIVRYFDI